MYEVLVSVVLTAITELALVQNMTVQHLSVLQVGWSVILIISIGLIAILLMYQLNSKGFSYVGLIIGFLFLITSLFTLSSVGRDAIKDLDYAVILFIGYLCIILSLNDIILKSLLPKYKSLKNDSQKFLWTVSIAVFSVLVSIIALFK